MLFKGYRYTTYEHMRKVLFTTVPRVNLMILFTAFFYNLYQYYVTFPITKCLITSYQQIVDNLRQYRISDES